MSVWSRLELRHIAQQEEPDEVLRAALAACLDVVPDGLVFGALPDGEGFRMQAVVPTRDERFRTVRPMPGRGLGGYVIDSGQVAAVDDYATDSRITGDFRDIVSGGEGLVGIVCVPIVVQDRVQGLLYGGRRSAGAIDDRGVARLEDAAHHVAIGLENAAARRRAVELQRLQDGERLARNLHDSVAQMLFGIGVAAQQSLRIGDRAGLMDAMREIEETASLARHELRQTLEQLAGCDGGIGFEARLEAELRLMDSSTGCVTRVSRGGAARPLPDLVEDVVIDAAVEGTRNAVKHAGATFVLVRIEYGAGAVKLTVQSESRDRPGPAATVTTTGCGIAALDRRARRLGGDAALIDGEAHTKVLRLRIPTAQVH